jgi:phosphoribosylamine-glycine ligase
MKNEYCSCVVMASGGYPKKYLTGLEIIGLDDMGQTEGALYIMQELNLMMENSILQRQSSWSNCNRRNTYSRTEQVICGCVKN